jgi:carboxyl-terminal processing protease
MNTVRRWTGAGLLAALALGLAACGGGGGSSGGQLSGGPPADPVWTAGHYDPPATFANMCAMPRSGKDPVTGQAYPDKLGSTVWEKSWIRAWSEAYYLWYRDLPDLNPAGPDTVAAYFKLMKTSALNPSGTSKDKQGFHFTMTTSQYESFFSAGAAIGYGVTWYLVPGSANTLYVAYTDPGTPAAAANLGRGEIAVSIDGYVLAMLSTQAQVDAVTAALNPTTAGESHTFVMQALNGTQRTVALTASNVTETPVQHVSTIPTVTGPVGYLQFNDHIESAEAELVQAIQTLGAAGVNDLVMDLRYNGGGLLEIASEAAFMVAGAARTSGRTFELIQFNDKYPTTNPITAQAIAPAPFYSTAQVASAHGALPSLNLPRVVVLGGPDTCSASESIINALNGIGVTVVLVGGQTCGKPYGFYPQDNCGTTYFSIEFRGVNAVGFGEYPDGFVAANAASANGGVSLPGCAVADDFTHALGDPAEAQLAAALQYLQSGTCPVATALSAPPAVTVGHVMKPVWRMNRILRRPH